MGKKPNKSKNGFFFGYTLPVWFFLIFLFVNSVLFLFFTTQTQPSHFKGLKEKLERYNSFLKEYGKIEDGKQIYGYNGKLDRIRKTETPHFGDQIYLDYTGSGLYQQRQIKKYTKMLLTELHGNTHSTSAAAKRTEKKVSEARERIVKFFNTSLDEYSVIFTAGATGALKLVAESFPFEKDSLYLYTKENHNSVLGIRELAKENGGTFKSATDEEIEKLINREYDDLDLDECKGINNLFAFPGESNFSGKKFNLEWINTILKDRKRKMRIHPTKKNGCGTYYTLLDAAAFVPTNKLDLSKYPADFVSISFYKIFGHPSGLGCLLVKNELKDLMRVKYWGGGTVEIADCDTSFCRLKEKMQARYEEGTINFLAIAAVKYGIDVIEEIGIEMISKHVEILRKYLYDELLKIEHPNGSSVVEIYGNHYLEDETKQGPIISFNLKKDDGDYVVHSKVMEKANKNNFAIRNGLHCNPGAAKIWISQQKQDMFKNFDQMQVCGSDHKKGTIPTGSVRVSLGYLTNFDDIDKFVQFIKKNFV